MKIGRPLFACVGFGGVACGSMLLVAALAQEPAHHWDYSKEHGPSHWGQLSPEFVECVNGHQQSPIDIRSTQKEELPPIRFDYKPSALDIIDNGHTIMINYGPGNFLYVGDKKYELKQFHFHRPSEEKIEGKQYPMSLHLVHADQEGKIAVVAVLLQQGDGNALMHELWQEMPKEKEKDERFDNIQIDADGLVPADHGYYTFDGSLTTPPCSEGVTWYVMKHPVTVSTAEIKKFSKLYRHNARPTQPLYDRVIMESK